MRNRPTVQCTYSTKSSQFYLTCTKIHFQKAFDIFSSIQTTGIVMLMQLWRPEFKLVGKSSGSWYHTHAFNGPFSGTTRVSRYQKGKRNLDFTGARDSEWQWHQLGHMQVCISLQADNHAITPPLVFLQAGCPSCRPTNSVKALKAVGTTAYQ